MRKFVSELKGRTVMTNEGLILGTISNFTVETSTGQIDYILLNPAPDIQYDSAKKDAQGRIIVPFKAMKSVRDVVIIELK